MADAKKAAKSGGRKPEIASLLGLLFGVGGVLGGLILEGGKLSDIIQFNAAVIVFGGTLGAVLVTTPLGALIRAAKRLISVLFAENHNTTAVLDEIIEYAVQARKQGIISLEQQAAAVKDPFLRKALNLAVDGIDMSQIRDIMELEMSVEEQDLEAEAKVFDVAGGYAPTIGIIGAVLGLMHVMKDLSDIDAVGRGIAAAFVATVYGVASANLILLPAGNKLRAQNREKDRLRETMLQGVLCIVEGLNPKLIRTKLEAFESGKRPAAKAAKQSAAAASPVSAEG
jgi:chemotaxis protein MotA